MLILVRHGETTANADGLLSGRVDVELTDRGLRQARAVARAVGPVDRLVSSPLSRAQATAGAWDQAIETDERFVEMHYGDFDGRRLADVPADIWSSWRRDIGFTPPGGESIAALGTRVRAGLDELAPAARDADIVVVSHVSPIKAAVAWALGVDDAVAWRMHLATASVTRIVIGPAGPSLHAYNDTSHLTTV